MWSLLLSLIELHWHSYYSFQLGLVSVLSLLDLGVNQLHSLFKRSQEVLGVLVETACCRVLHHTDLVLTDLIQSR